MMENEAVIDGIKNFMTFFCRDTVLEGLMRFSTTKT